MCVLIGNASHFLCLETKKVSKENSSQKQSLRSVLFETTKGAAPLRDLEILELANFEMVLWPQKKSV